MLWGIGKGRDHGGLDGLDGGETPYIVGHNVAVALLIYPLSLARRAYAMCHVQCTPRDVRQHAPVTNYRQP